MNAYEIFNDMWDMDIHDHFRTYNDTVDPRREWTLCGQLADDQKIILRKLIREVKDWSPYAIEMFALMDGDTTIMPSTEYSFYFTCCWDMPNVYASTWIHHNNPRYIDSILHYIVPHSGWDNPPTDYIVLSTGVKYSCLQGTPVFPAVGKIIHADIICRKTQKTIKWLQEHNSRQSIFTYAECVMADGDEFYERPGIDDMFRACLNPSSEHIDAFDLDDVRTAGLFSINALVPVHDIWRVFGAGMMRCVDAKMEEIVEMIGISRNYHTLILTSFAEMPDECADIAIICDA